MFLSLEDWRKPTSSSRSSLADLHTKWLIEVGEVIARLSICCMELLRVLADGLHFVIQFAASKTSYTVATILIAATQYRNCILSNAKSIT